MLYFVGTPVSDHSNDVGEESTPNWKLHPTARDKGNGEFAVCAPEGKVSAGIYSLLVSIARDQSS